MIGALRSNNLTLLIFCVRAAAVPDASYIPFSANPMVSVSVPSATNFKGSPSSKVEVLSVYLTLEGYWERSCAVPSLMLSTNAVESIRPVPSLAEKTFSLITTVKILLFVERVRSVICGASLSLSLTVRRSCVISAAFPAASNIAFSTISTVSFSTPVGSPRDPIPSV